MGKLDGRAAIVTGSGTGIGRAIALTLAREGADVVLGGRTPASLEEVAGETRGTGRKAIAVPVDVSVRQQVQNIVGKAMAEFGRIDILVNNAGISRRGLIADMAEDDWDAVMDINLKGTFLMMQAVIPHMIERSYGRIVNIGSIAQFRPAREGMSAYGASKAGVEQLTMAAALELTRYNIRTNCIAPGNVETPIYRRGVTEKQIQEWIDSGLKAPIGRIGDPQEMANVALFLISDESSFICGETIVADGGRTAKQP
jgi:NAD(P)-dependent dehydrogenase (short-subunit alcohol dehydrogenase family)